MNPRAWCFVQNGPCERECFGSGCKHARDILPIPPIDEPVIPQPRRMDGTPFEVDERVPAGFTIGVLTVCCTICMALALGLIIGRTMQCQPMNPIAFTILGQPVSKANSREIATIGPKDARRTIVRKSDKGIAYERDALRQIPPAARLRICGPVKVSLRCFYASERPDLDESIVLDVMQDRYTRDKLSAERILIQAGVYRNDRQVREKHVYHFIDKSNPRVEVRIEPLVLQQIDMPLETFGDLADKRVAADIFGA